MYIDEVGNADMGPSSDTNERFLSLTGVIVRLDHVRTYLHPTLEDLKQRYFGSHPDVPVVFHRRDMIRAQRDFIALRDPLIRSKFDGDLFEFLVATECTVLTVVIDKQTHKAQYGAWAFHPYHYCLEILLERYVLWLTRQQMHGDVMAESRGGNEDRLLKGEYSNIYDNGTNFLKAPQVQARLTTRQLKVEQKARNIAGLQLADALAAPCLKWAQCKRSGSSLPGDFGGQVAALVEISKFDRSPRGAIEGWGVKWLP